MSAVFPRPVKELLNDFEVSLSRELLALVTALCELLLLDDFLDCEVVFWAQDDNLSVSVSSPKKATRQDVVSLDIALLFANRANTFHFSPLNVLPDFSVYD